jgi:ribosomal protein S18 acetylase RimI-like enzyme
MTGPFEIHALGEAAGDRDWVKDLVTEQWGADTVVTRGTVYRPATLSGYVAWQSEERIGLVNYHLEGDACEIITLASLRPGIGAGTALIETVRRVAQEAGCRRLRVITTNDNIEALRFYQKRGFRLTAVHRNALELTRRIKPEIPLIGMHGIPLRDEIELEMPLG